MNRFKISLLLSYICTASISAAIITPALPQIEGYYHLSHGNLEWIVSIFLLGYVLGQLIYGPLSNRFGRLTALRTGLLINIAGVLVCLASVWLHDFPLLLIGRLISALGAAAGLSCTFILLNELLAKELAKQVLSFAVVAFTVGIGLAVTIGGLITQYSEWYHCFLFLLGHGIIMLILTWQFPETLEKAVPFHLITILFGYTKALKSNELILFSLTAGLISAFSYCYSAAAPIYAQINLHLTPSAYGVWNSINMFGMMASGFIASLLIRKIGSKYLILLGLTLMIPGLLLLMLISKVNQTNPIWFFSTTMFLYLLSGLLFPAASYFASNAIDDKASASSMMSFINMSSAMLAVTVMGYLPFNSLNSLIAVMTTFLILVFISIIIYFIKNPDLTN